MILQSQKISTFVLCTLIFAFSLLFAGQSAGSQAAGQIRDPYSKALSDLEMVNTTALRRAIADLTKTFGADYPGGRDYLKTLETCEKRLPAIKDALKRTSRGGSRTALTALSAAEEIVAFQRQALLSNPLLNFERLLLIKRKPIGDPRRAEEPDRGIGKFVGMPQQSSWQIQTMTNTDGWDNEISILSPAGPEGKLTTLYSPPDGRLISEMDLDFDAGKLMFSMPDGRKLWQVFEIRIDGSKLRQISPDDQPDVHNFDFRIVIESDVRTERFVKSAR